MEYIVHGSKSQNDSKLKLTLGRDTDMRDQDLLKHIETSHRFNKLALK